MARHIGWFDSSQDWTRPSEKTVAISSAFSDELMQEYREIVSIISELRPFIIDYLCIERDFSELSTVEALLTAEIQKTGVVPFLAGTAFMPTHVAAQHALTNFLISASTFLERTICRIARTYGNDSTEAIGFKELRQMLYSQSFGYRLCYHLRNFSQHQESPLDIIPIHAKADGEHYKVSIKLELERDNLVKGIRKIRDEVSKQPPKIPVLPCAQDYFRCLSQLFHFLIHTQADRIGNLVGYIAAIKRTFKNMPSDAVPFIWEGDFPPTNPEFQIKAHSFSIDELERLIQIMRAIRARSAGPFQYNESSVSQIG
ncbi:MAG: hypothetical protein WD044_14505 [Dongiaceae bacterium]